MADVIKSAEINIKSNAKEVAQDVEKLNKGLDETGNKGDDVGKVTENFKSLKAQLREAQAEVQKLSEKFGASSVEAVNAAKKAAELKDAIGDAAALTDAFNPDAKFKALTSSLSGVAGGFAAAQGGMALLGVQSESVEKTLLKVQSAMAISQGLQSVGESIDSFKQLGTVVTDSYNKIIKSKFAVAVATQVEELTTRKKTAADVEGVTVKTTDLAVTEASRIAKIKTAVATNVVTAAQWLWNKAILANPIVAIIAAVIALGVGIYQLTSYFVENNDANTKSIEASKKAKKALEEQAKAAEKTATQTAKNNQYQYDLAKASGASAEELRKLAIKQQDAAIATNLHNTMIARSTFLKERDRLATAKANGASDEAIKLLEENTQASYKEFNKQREGYYKSKEDKVDIIRQQNVEIAQENTTANKKASDNATAAANKSKEELEKRLADEKKIRETHLNEIDTLEKKYVDGLETLKAKTAQEQLDLEKKRAEDELKTKTQTALKNVENDIFDAKNAANNAKLKAEAKEKIEKEAGETSTALTNFYNQKQTDLNNTTKKEEEDKLKAFLEGKKARELEFGDATTAQAIQIILDRKLKEQEQEQIKAIEAAEKLGKSEQEKQAILDYYAQLKGDTVKSAGEKEVEIEKGVADAKKNINDSAAEAAQGLLGIISGLGEKNKGIQKAALLANSAISIAQIIANTNVGSSKEVATKGVFGLSTSAVLYAKMGVSIAAVVAATAKGLSALGGGGSVSSSGAGGSSSGGGGATASTQPSVSFVSSSENQLANSINRQQGEQTIRAYVVSREMSTQQELDRNLQSSTSMG